MKLYTLPKGLKNARTEAGYTQAKLAKELGTHIKTIMNWEQGKATPTLGTLMHLSSFYDCDLDYLTGRLECKTHDIQYIHNVTGLSESSIEILQRFHNAENRSSLWPAYISSIIESNDFSKLMNHISDFLGAAEFEGIHAGLNDHEGMFDNIDNQAAQLFYISHVLTNMLEEIAVKHRIKGLDRIESKKSGKEVK